MSNIISLPLLNKLKFLSNTPILLGFREYFLKFYPLLNLYLSSTYPLPKLYKSSTFHLLQKHVLCCNKRSLLRNKGSLFCNKTSLLPTSAILQARYLFPTWEYFIPNVGTFYSQRGNITLSTWEYHAFLFLLQVVCRPKVEL